ncbi:hypothetical protein OIB37_00580 [Streptomyces sp. NBC_00820]|nr:hypothetical protein OIB37_00580 [Streptomyces sp. NBC_00820]
MVGKTGTMAFGSRVDSANWPVVNNQNEAYGPTAEQRPRRAAEQTRT